MCVLTKLFILTFQQSVEMLICVVKSRLSSLKCNRRDIPFWYFLYMAYGLLAYFALADLLQFSDVDTVCR